MTEPGANAPEPTTHSPRRRRSPLLPLATAVAGLLAGGLIFNPGTASGDVTTWTNVDLAATVGDNTTSGFAPVSVGLDDEDFVHLRGGITVIDGEMARIGTTSGPWVTGVNDDVLPCRYWPEYNVGVVNGAYDETGVTDFGVGAVIITQNGQILAGGNSIPLIPDGPVMKATFTAALDNISWQAADADCVDEP